MFNKKSNMIKDGAMLGAALGGLAGLSGSESLGGAVGGLAGGAVGGAVAGATFGLAFQTLDRATKPVMRKKPMPMKKKLVQKRDPLWDVM